MPVIYDNQRQYSARLGGVGGVSVLFQRAEEIPSKVATGSADIGITGEDLYREQFDQSDELVLAIPDLGYGQARLVVAVPNSWIDVSSMEDLDELAVSFRLRHNRNLRIATKFPNLSRQFLASRHIVDYSLVESLGATESAPSSGSADLLIDLTSSGKTLLENHLKVLKDGTVISSKACLIAGRRLRAWGQEKLGRLEILLDLMESYLRGRDTYNLQAVIQDSRLAELAVLGHPWLVVYSVPTNDTASLKTKKGSLVVIRVTCPRDHLYEAIRRLRESGAGDIIVTQPEYVFRDHSESFHQVRYLVKKTSNAERLED
jgi:ATP phosphoribosyltransferase